MLVTPAGRVKGLDSAFTLERDRVNHLATITGLPELEGDYEIVLKGSGNSLFPGNTYQSLFVHVMPSTVITPIHKATDNNAYYNLQGIRLEGVPTRRCIYIHSGKKVLLQ